MRAIVGGGSGGPIRPGVATSLTPGGELAHCPHNVQDMTPRKTFDEAELRERLTPLQFDVTQKAGTEPAFTGQYWDNHEPGNYHCVVCGELLFRADTKFESGTGWPSFYEAIDPDKVELIEDRSHGMVRTEVRCATCGAHLGHLF